MQVQTDAEAAAARKARRRAFGDGIDPVKPWRETPAPAPLPRAGTPSPLQAPAIVAPAPALPITRPQYAPAPLTHAEMARALKRRMEEIGGRWDAQLYARMAELWPEGAPEEQLGECMTALLRGGLRAVGGAA